MPELVFHTAQCFCPVTQNVRHAAHGFFPPDEHFCRKKKTSVGVKNKISHMTKSLFHNKKTSGGGARNPQQST